MKARTLFNITAAFALIACIAGAYALGTHAGSGRPLPFAFAMGDGAQPPAALQGGAEALREDLDDLRGRVVALEDAASRAADLIAQIVPRLPPIPPTPEQVLGRIAALATQVENAGTRLPVVEASGARSQETVRILMDPRCPYCRQGHQGAMALALEGRARLEFIPIGLLGEDSQTGAIAILTLASLDPAAGVDLIERLFALPRAADAGTIEAGVAASLAKFNRSAADYEAALPVGTAAHELILKTYVEMKIPSGVPVYLRASGDAIRGTLGYRPADEFRRQLGF